VVDGGEPGEHLGALLDVEDGAAGTLQPPHRGIAVEPDDEHVAERPGRGEVAHVAGVEEVEAAVGEHHALAGGTQRREARRERLHVGSQLRNPHRRRP